MSKSAESASSRRAFLGGLTGAAAAVALAPQALKAQGKAKKPPRLQHEAIPVDWTGASINAPSEWASPVGRLVRRATMGMNAGELNAAKAQGYQNWLQSQLDYQRIDTTAVDAQVAALWPTLSQPVESLFQLDQGTVYNTLQAAWLYRAARSPRQLYERMVEFWNDHFNIDVSKVGYLKIVDEREVIRKNALGKFGDLVKASAKSAAMLAYLDQQLSRVGSPNQNYARELLELHTLGVDNGYTQDDVAELSRVLTGWTLAGRGNFAFQSNLHDFGAKTVMGVNIPATPSSTGAAAIAEGEQIIDMLVRHPNTAKFISTKLLKWFVTPEPTATQISAVSSVFRASGGDLKLVVRAVLNQGWIASAPLKFKRPFHYLVSALRGSNATIVNTQALNGQLTIMGQPVYLWETPDGFPDLFEFWSSNLMPRWQVASTISNFRTGNLVIDSAPYLTGTRDAAIDLLNTNFFGGEMDLGTRTALLGYLNGGTFNDTRVRETMSLAIASEHFQWY